jgi:hypothetical protein
MAPKITATNDVQEIHVALSAVWEAMDGSSLKGVMYETVTGGLVPREFTAVTINK